MEPWQILLSIAGMSIPVIMAMIARDRSIIAMIHNTAKESERKLKHEADTLHSRLNRTRDEHVKKDDFISYTDRAERQFTELKNDMKQNFSEATKRLDEIIKHIK